MRTLTRPVFHPEYDADQGEAQGHCAHAWEYAERCDEILARKDVPFIESIRAAIAYDPARYPTPRQAYWVDVYFRQVVQG
jgi:hypothetical protein